MTDIVSDIVDALTRVIGPADGPVPLHEPELVPEDLALVQDCVTSGWVSSVGAYVNRLETELAGFTGARYAVAVVNGTAALHTALLVAGVRPGDEVLVPSLTFVATANAISYCGAVPHFVDSDPARLAVAPEALAAHLEAVVEVTDAGAVNRQTGRPIRALLPVHILGVPADMDALLDIAARYGLVVVEDAAESLGSYAGARHTGTMGAVAALSFNGNKVITTGGGGAVLTDDPDIADRVRHLTTTARVPAGPVFVHDEVGYNYRLPNLNAALGCSQLGRLPDMLARKRRLAGDYAAAFEGIDGAALVAEPDGCRANFWLNGLLLETDDVAMRDAVIAATNDAGYQTRPAWTPMHMLPMYGECPRSDLAGAERIFNSLVCLPSSATLVAPEALAS